MSDSAGWVGGVEGAMAPQSGRLAGGNLDAGEEAMAVGRLCCGEVVAIARVVATGARKVDCSSLLLK